MQKACKGLGRLWRRLRAYEPRALCGVLLGRRWYRIFAALPNAGVLAYKSQYLTSMTEGGRRCTISDDACGQLGRVRGLKQVSDGRPAVTTGAQLYCGTL